MASRFGVQDGRYFKTEIIPNAGHDLTFVQAEMVSCVLRRGCRQFLTIEGIYNIIYIRPTNNFVSSQYAPGLARGLHF